MKKRFLKQIAVAMAVVCLSLPACTEKDDHTHTFNLQNTKSDYLKSEATCLSPAFYYYSCECGAKGEKTFFVGRGHGHSFTAEVATEEYVIDKGDCLTAGTYYKSCVYCGEKGYDFTTFQSSALGNHDFSNADPQGKYIQSEATQDASAVYYKSCKCGAMGTETFSHGEALREYTADEKVPYTPTSLTVTLYDIENGTYGFTYNTQSRPLRPVIQIAEGDSLSGEYKEYNATVEEASSYQKDGIPFTYYIVKAEVPMQSSTAYTYRAYDKYVDIGTPTATIHTKDASATSFSFAHVSDTQMTESSGDLFGRVLSCAVEENDFVLHTGDVVEWSKYESEWTDMLHSNFAYLSQIPVMAISGNHETTYQNGASETYKHFHNKIPQQESTKLGYFYSFVYGNAKFIMLNTNDLTGNQLKPEQYDWLVEELENNTATWTFVSMHNPMYSVGKWGSNPDQNSISLALKKQLQGIFADYGVDVVLQGHDHTVSRTYPINAQGEALKELPQEIDGVEYSVNPNGVIYVLSGAAGAQAREPFGTYNASQYAYVASTSYACSWADFTIEGNTLTVTAQYATGTGIKQYEQWGIQKTA